MLPVGIGERREVVGANCGSLWPSSAPVASQLSVLCSLFPSGVQQSGTLFWQNFRSLKKMRKTQNPQER